MWTRAPAGDVVGGEVWLHGPTPDVASVGVFEARVVVWIGRELHELAVPTREALEDVAPRVVTLAREQIARFERHAETGARLDALASELADALTKRLRYPVGVWGVRRATHASGAESTLRSKERELARLEGHDDVVHAHAGAACATGWDGELVDVATHLDAIVHAIETMGLTLESLAKGRRYRVRESIGGLVAGRVVTFSAFDDVDNHFGRYVFVEESGVEVSVDGDYSVPVRSPLGATARYLEEVDVRARPRRRT